MYIADGINYRLIEVADEDVRIQGEVLMSNTDKPLLNDRFHIDNNHTFNYIAWFTSHDAAVQHLGKEARESIESEKESLAKLKAKVERMESAIRVSNTAKINIELVATEGI